MVWFRIGIGISPATCQQGEFNVTSCFERPVLRRSDRRGTVACGIHCVRAIHIPSHGSELSGVFGSSATGIGAGHAAGYEIYNIYYVRHAPHYQLHAIYWPARGSPVDLNPSGSPYSEATGVSGARQSGYASIFVNGCYHSHALVWQGSPSNATDLSLPGDADTYADGISGTQVVGQGTGTATGGYAHAVLWDLAHGTIVDLNGTNHQESGAVAVSGTTQVGWANDATGANQHAMLWQVPQRAPST
jgi:hypothetical protein